ncbi:L-type lectin family protein [Levilactobacillus tujiorum]|uniref:hypothetical protein n=1 Tax=Levilactobacillus tujiorum TaxID=2912243 RepID=UPI001456BDD2|nr:hypothetical protein [Levilactobacillus tujiorum]NLR31807.1 hypothetical protein [Levilactobacillus tujiorum]
MHIKKNLLGVLALSIAGLGVWSTEPAQANSTVFSTGDKALAGAPQGVDLQNGLASNYFTIDKNVDSATGDNSASLVSAGSPTGVGNSAIQISKAGVSDSWGAIWSTDESFDLDKSETASMWIYASGENASNVGDGMAFVLQNGGTDAYSGSGESMGVWGIANQYFNNTNPASSAIQNSWALEFDTFPNDDIFKRGTYLGTLIGWTNSSYDFANNNPSSFDVNGPADTPSSQSQITDTHIASNYPGATDTYTGTSVVGNGKIKSPLTGNMISGSGTFYYYNLQHEGLLDEGPTGGSGNLSDHRWHHITVTYTPPTTSGGKGSMTYTYNDKNPDTGLPQSSSDSATVPIDLSQFNLSSGQTKVRWGFTGSTGTYSENNLVIFDQIPGEAQTKASATITAKDSSGEYTNTLNDGDSVSGDTDVKLTYQLERTGGDSNWKAVNGELKIPDDIDITSGSISYPDSSYTDSNDNKVDVSKIVAPSSSGDGQTLAVPLADDGLTLSGTQKATVTLYGKVKNVASSGSVSEAAQTSYFVGSNATSAAKTPSFTITKPDLSVALDEDSSTLKVNAGGTQAASVVGVAVASDSTVSNSDITIHPTINGVEQDAVNLDDITTGVKYGFNYPIANDKLTAGDNTVSFYATDSAGARSSTVSTTVTAGTVGFGDTSGDLTFEPTTLSGSGSTIINRSGDWRLDVDDSQTKDSTWQVTANTTGMYLNGVATGTPLDGALIYTDSTGNVTTLNSSDSPIIASGTSDGTDTTTNIASDWTTNSGIRLKVNSGAVEGTYSGTINWSFVNSVK